MFDKEIPENIPKNTHKVIKEVLPDGTLVKFKRGRTITEAAWVRPWVRKRQAYKKARGELAKLISEQPWDAKGLDRFLSTPQAGLGGRAPKRLINPRSLKVLLAWFKRNRNSLANI